MEKSARIDFRDQISRNKWKSFLLMFSIFVIIIVLGYVISFAFVPDLFYTILIFSIIISIFYVSMSYYNSDKIALASVGAREVKRGENKMYYDIVESLTIASGLPMPRLYVMSSSQINAFASGRDPKHAVVCVTQGALEKLERR